MRAVSGVLLGQRYRLTEPIASGGMGEVWQAHDDLLGRTVAVKVLREELVSEPGFLARFRTEARNTARLAHANIATTYDYGESDGSAWLVMELVPGEPLSDILAREGALDPRRAMRLLARAAAGLAAAHAAGIVHRDVKPGNLLVTPDGNVKVTDFGIARAAAEAPLTATGQVMGTAAYLAPEQATGRRDLTPAVDVYALGVVAHEMLAGERPFTGESQVAIALAQVNDPPPPLPRWVPGTARELVALCLAKDARDRPASAGTVAEAAARIADGDDAGAMAVLEGAQTGHPQAGQPGTGHPGTGHPAWAADTVDPTVVALPATAALPPEAADPSGAATEHLPWESTGGYRQPRTGQQGRYDEFGQQGQHGQRDQHGQYDAYDHDEVNARAAATGATGARTGPYPSTPPAPTRRRLTAPLLGLVAVLLVVLVVLLVKQVSGGTDTPTPTGSTSSSAPPSPSASTPTPQTSSPSPSVTPATPTPSQTPSESDTPSTSTPTASSPSESGSPSVTGGSSPVPTSPDVTSASATAPASPSASAASSPA